MIELSAGWRRCFSTLMVVFVVMVVVSLVLQTTVLFAAALVVGIVIGGMGMVKLRCPHCRKLVFQETTKLRLEGTFSCPKCGEEVTIRIRQ